MQISKKYEKVIFGLLLLLIVLTALPYGTVQVWWESAFIISILVLFCFWAIGDAVAGHWHLRGKPVTLPLLSLSLFAFLQSLAVLPTPSDSCCRAISADPVSSWFFAAKMFALTVFLELVLRFASSRRRLKFLVYTGAGTALVSAAFGIVRELVFGGNGEFALPALKPGAGFAQFINRNHFALLMLMSVGLIFGLIAASARSQLKIFYAGLALLLVTALALTASRGGFFTFIIQIWFLLLLYSFNAFKPGSAETDFASEPDKKRIWIIARQAVVSLILLVILISGISWLGGEKMAHRLEKLPGEVDIEQSETGGTRLNLWVASWHLFKENEIAGVGFGAYKYAISKHFDYSGRFRFEQAHNDYVELLVSGGLIGAILAVWFVAGLIRSAKKAIKKSDSEVRLLKLGALTGLVGVIIHSFVDFGLHTTFNALIAVILVAVLIGQFDESEFENTKSRINQVF